LPAISYTYTVQRRVWVLPSAKANRNRLGFGAMSPHSYAALLNEIAKMRDEIEDLRASAIAWRELYEASAKRCA
jgi:hypothetical protein